MKDLRYFEEYLQAKDPSLLVHTQKEISAKYEISALIKNLGAGIGQSDHPSTPAVFFERVKESSMPVICNLFGTRRILARSLEVDEIGITDRLNQAVTHLVQPVMVEGGPIQEVVHTGKDVSLSTLPIVTHCEGDVAPYITAGLMILADSETRRLNMGMYRFMVQGERQLGANLVFTHDAYNLFRKNEIAGKDLDVVIMIGHHPAVYLASQSYDPEISELAIAGNLLGEPLAMTKCRTVDLRVPAFGEIAIEGKIKAGRRQLDGPFAEYAGYYCDPVQNCVIEVTAITHRRDARYLDIYNAGVEHIILYSAAVEALVHRRLRQIFGNHITDVYVPPSGIGHLVYISIRNPYEGLVRNIGMAALTVPHIKFSVIVDDDVDIKNSAQMTWSLVTRTDPDTSFFFVPDAYASGGDPMAYSARSRSERGRMSTKTIVDGTRPLGRPFAAIGSPPLDKLSTMMPTDFLPMDSDHN